jgi:hypothetical protein
MYYKEGNDAAIELLNASRCAFHNHMHLDRTNNASKNDCEIANTHAHGDDHLVMLACLRRRLSLSGREAVEFDRMRSLFDRTHPVRVQRLRVSQLFDRTSSASGHDRPDMFGR